MIVLQTHVNVLLSPV